MTALTEEEILSADQTGYGYRHLLPDRPGLYCAIVDGKTIVYVGATKRSLRKRWSWHHRSEEMKAMGKVTIAFQTYTDMEEMLRIEAETIKALKPALNVMGVEGRMGCRPSENHSFTSKGLIRGSVQWTPEQYDWLEEESIRLGLGSIAGAARFHIQQAMNAETAKRRGAA